MASNSDEFKDVQKQPKIDWNSHEVALIVADYFEMLEAELLGEPFNKTDHRKLLVRKLHSRTESSIERKHQNISGVLLELGLPYIDGYKPYGNFQKLLATEVGNFLDRNPGFLEKLASAPMLNPSEDKQGIQPDFNQIIESPPDKIVSPDNTSKPWISRKVRRIDFAERDAANRQLAALGEKFVFDFEQYRLNQIGRDDLAQRVVWASKDIGDGLGFDILSFDEADDSEQMLEVKTTGLGKFFPFYVTQNEVRCSEDIPHQYHLFRVFNFGKQAGIYTLHGSLRERCQLDPVVYRATL